MKLGPYVNADEADTAYASERRRYVRARFLERRDAAAFRQYMFEKSRQVGHSDVDLLTTGGMYQTMFDMLDELQRQRPKLALMMAAEGRCVRAVNLGQMNNSACVTASKFV